MSKTTEKERKQTRQFIIAVLLQIAIVILHLIVHHASVAFEWDYNIQSDLSLFGTLILSIIAIGGFDLSFLVVAASEFIFLVFAYVILNQNVVVLYFVISYGGAENPAPFSNPVVILIVKLILDGIVFLFSKWINWD